MGTEYLVLGHFRHLILGTPKLLSEAIAIEAQLQSSWSINSSPPAAYVEHVTSAADRFLAVSLPLALVSQ